MKNHVPRNKAGDLAPELIPLAPDEQSENDENAVVGVKNKTRVYGDGEIYMRVASSAHATSNGRAMFFYHKGKRGYAGKPDEHYGVGIGELLVEDDDVVTDTVRGELIFVVWFHFSTIFMDWN